MVVFPELPSVNPFMTCFLIYDPSICHNLSSPLQPPAVGSGKPDNLEISESGERI